MYIGVTPHSSSEECETTRLVHRSTNCIASFHDLSDATIHLTNRYQGLICTLHGVIDDDIHWLYRYYDMSTATGSVVAILLAARQSAAGLAPVLEVTLTATRRHAAFVGVCAQLFCPTLRMCGTITHNGGMNEVA